MRVKNPRLHPVILAKARIQIGRRSQLSSMKPFLDPSRRWKDRMLSFPAIRSWWVRRTTCYG